MKTAIALVAGLLLTTACGDSTEDADSTSAASTTQSANTAQTSDATKTGDAMEQASPTESGFSPSTPECVAPADAGGGWDFTCREIGKLLEDLGLTKNVVVTNLPGGGGGVAFADVAANRNDDDNLIVAASPATAIRFAQNQYSGLGADEFRWIGAIGADFGVVAVAADSEYQTLDDLVAAMQANPSSVVWGGGSPQGGQDHFKVLQLAEAIGVDPAAVPWVAYDGGGEAQAALAGGEITVFPGDVSETLGNEDLRILAVLADERVPSMPDAPTATELGYDVTFPIWRGLAAPGGMSDDVYQFWVDALGQLEASSEWQNTRDDSGLSPLRLLGEDFNTFVLEAVDNYRELSEPFGLVAH